MFAQGKNKQTKDEPVSFIAEINLSTNDRMFFLISSSSSEEIRQTAAPTTSL